MLLRNWIVCAPVTAVLLATSLPVTVSGETWTVARGDNLQTALNAAAPGDVILLEPGVEYVGNFVLPVKSGDGPIIVRTAHSASLPPDGRRIHPDHSPVLARLRSPNAMSALRTAAGAHHWHLQYLEFGANQHGHGDILQIGDGSSKQNSLAKVPHNLVLSHLYIHGDELLGQKRCIALNAAHVTIRDSHVAECKGVGMDTQAIGGWNGPGPYTIENNYLEAAGENVMFGGADPAIPNLVPEGITIRRNHFSRPVSWRDPVVSFPEGVQAMPGEGGLLPAGTYSYRVVARRPVGQGAVGRSLASAEATAVVGDGGAVHLAWQAVPLATEYYVYGRTPASQDMFWKVTTTAFIDTGSPGTARVLPGGATVWTVKNLFELKNARNVRIEENIFENHWKEAQAGYAIVLTPRNSGGACTWCVVEEVRFERNIVRRVAAGVNILGYDSPSRPTRQTRSLTFRNNLFYDVGQTFAGNGLVFLVGDEPRDIVIDHNTISHSGSAFIYAYGGTASNPRRIYGMQVTNNAVRHSHYGINGAFFAYGNGVIGSFMPGAIVTANLMAGGPASRYPAGNLFAGAFVEEFEDAANEDFRLLPSSPLRGAASDGGNIGADIATLLFQSDGVGAALLAAPRNLRIEP